MGLVLLRKFLEIGALSGRFVWGVGVFSDGENAGRKYIAVRYPKKLQERIDRGTTFKGSMAPP